jgi:two-component system chemotaxis response regulator CheY
MAKVLIIDDSESFRTTLKTTLLEDGHEVIEAVDGIEALVILEKSRDIELIFCDFNMPRMDGLAFATEINKMPRHSSIPIVMLTTEASAELKKKAKTVGVRGWIIKPFEAEKLRAGLKLLLKTAA